MSGHGHIWPMDLSLLMLALFSYLVFIFRLTVRESVILYNFKKNALKLKNVYQAIVSLKVLLEAALHLAIGGKWPASYPSSAFLHVLENNGL